MSGKGSAHHAMRKPPTRNERPMTRRRLTLPPPLPAAAATKDYGLWWLFYQFLILVLIKQCATAKNSKGEKNLREEVDHNLSKRRN